MKKRKPINPSFICPHCEYNWRGCHNPRRPNVTSSEGCNDFRKKGEERESEKLSNEWVKGLDLSGLGRNGKKRKK